VTVSARAELDRAAPEPRTDRPLLSVVSPAFNEERNLPLLHERIVRALAAQGVDWEWIVVDDHSQDATFETVGALARDDPRVRGLRLARNSGAHAAVVCGLDHARGDCAVIMAGDLQDPPEAVPSLLAQWRRGAQVVWATRERRGGENTRTVLLSRVYHWLMRRVVGIREMPARGADFFLLDRRVLDAFRRFGESNANIFALITWMGFRQASIVYDKEARTHGRSGWTLEKKLKLVVDSITSFTYLPIRAMSYVGFAVAVLGFAYAALVVYNALLGQPVEGWSSLMVAVLVVGGVQMLMMGVLGEYLWRALDEARRRPRYLVEASTERPPAGRDGR
jgi:dolichol-phosphate mannosyltransferase